MTVSLQGKLVVALSSRALFDFEDENRVFAEQDDSAYMRLQLSRLDIPAKRGVAFPLVQKLLRFNGDGDHRVEVVILSRNDPVSGLRVFRSVDEWQLKLERGVFTRGRPPYNYLGPLGANLFLSADEGDVRQALTAGFPAARGLLGHDGVLGAGGARVARAFLHVRDLQVADRAPRHADPRRRSSARALPPAQRGAGHAGRLRMPRRHVACRA